MELRVNFALGGTGRILKNERPKRCLIAVASRPGKPEEKNIIQLKGQKCLELEEDRPAVRWKKTIFFANSACVHCIQIAKTLTMDKTIVNLRAKMLTSHLRKLFCIQKLNQCTLHIVLPVFTKSL